MVLAMLILVFLCKSICFREYQGCECLRVVAKITWKEFDLSVACVSAATEKHHGGANIF